MVDFVVVVVKKHLVARKGGEIWLGPMVFVPKCRGKYKVCFKKKDVFQILTAHQLCFATSARRRALH
jgi:hypothetical protein